MSRFDEFWEDIWLTHPGDRALAKTAWDAAHPQWISVEDGLPEVGDRVLCTGRAGLRFGTKLPAILSNPIGIRPEGCHGFDESVTHWMPLPEPPQ